MQDTSTSDISQSATGSFNAGYADQIPENGSKTLQRSGGSLNDNFSSQSLGQDNQVLQVQQGTGNMSRVFRSSRLEPRPPRCSKAVLTMPWSNN